MNKTEILSALNKIFNDVFDRGDLVLDESISASDIEDWDSLMHVNILIQTERAFNIKFTLDEISKLVNVGAMVALIERKLKS